MKHAHISRNITHNYRHNELDCQGIIVLYNKMNESSNNNWNLLLVTVYAYKRKLVKRSIFSLKLTLKVIKVFWKT